jgi:uncharacterized protein with PQ loop repeat
MPVRWFFSIVAAVLLTGYQLPAIVRIIRRRSSMDYSLPAQALCISGLACYVAATIGTPANFSAWVSLTNVSVMALVIIYYREPQP